MTIHNPWETSPSKSGLVSIGTHKLFLRSMGPARPRRPQEPVVLIENGGGSPSFPLVGFMRALAPTVRVLAYDRAGLGDSEPATTKGPRNSLDIADEFNRLLQVANIRPPYLLMAQSYGGVQVRTWMELFARGPGEVIGMVLVDTADEDLYRRLPIRERDWSFLRQLNWEEVLGLDHRYKLLTPEEWEECVHGDPGHEELDVDANAKRLGWYEQYERRALGDAPVSVIKGYLAEDLRLLCAEAERIGLGSAEQRRHITQCLPKLEEVMQSTEHDQLRLSSRGRMVYARKSGHNVALTEPELIIDEIKWVLDSYTAQRLGN